MNIKIISKYAGRLSYKINRAIRGDTEFTKELQNEMIELDAAIVQLESINNSTVYRADRMGDWEWVSEWYKNRIGLVFTRPDYLSTYNYETKNIYNLIIKTSSNSNCMDIVPPLLASSVPADNYKANNVPEGVFKRNTNFIIIGVDEEMECILLEETTEDSEIRLTKKEMEKSQECHHFWSNKPHITPSASELGLL